MTLQDYAKHLNNLLKSNPHLKNRPVVSAIDEEGNGYNSVNFSPTQAIVGKVEIDITGSVGFDDYKSLYEEATEAKYGDKELCVINHEMIDGGRTALKDGDAVIIIN